MFVLKTRWRDNPVKLGSYCKKKDGVRGKERGKVHNNSSLGLSNRTRF